MKLKKTLTWAAVLAMAVTPLTAYTAFAAGETVDATVTEDGIFCAGELQFAYDVDGELCVGVPRENRENITGDVKIPSYIKYGDSTKMVTSIGAKRLNNFDYISDFGNCENIKTVYIPETIKYTTVLNAFAGCTSLEQINVDPENEVFSSADGVLFETNNLDKKVLDCYPGGKKDKTYAIPDGTQELGIYAFKGISELTAIYIPQSIEQISESSFVDCSNIKDIYYAGTEEEWEAIQYEISSALPRDGLLKKASIHFNAAASELPEETSPAVKVQNFNDETTGISVTAASGVLPEGVTFNAKLLDSTADSNKYDLSFTDTAGNEVQPNGKVTVSIPLPAGWETAYAYRVEGGTKTFLPSEIKNGKVVFITDHFSVYMFTTEELDTSDEPATSEPTESESSVITPGDTDGNSGNNSGGNSGNDQADTGIALAIAPAALACVAVIAVSKKRK